MGPDDLGAGGDRDEDDSVRNNAAYALGETGLASEPVARALAGALSDQDRGVSLSAARSLWVLGVEREAALRRILESLREDDGYQRAAREYARDLRIPVPGP